MSSENDWRPDEGDRLDDLLRQALAVDDDERQLARLRNHWRSQFSRQIWRRRLRRTVPLAAAAALAAVSLMLLRQTDREEPPPTRPGPPPVVAEQNMSTREVVVPEDIPRQENLPLLGREPTAYERIVFAARTIPTRSGPNKRVPRMKVEDMVLRLRQTSQADLPEILVELGYRQEEAVSRLLTAMRQPTLRPDALEVLEKLVGTAGLASLARQASAAEAREILAGHLLSGESDAALREYLWLVADAGTREAALAVAKRLPRPPIDRLFAILDDDDPAARSAAAFTLGRLNGPEVTQRLIAHATEKTSASQEAWVALLACRGEMAREFLAYAEQQPRLLGHYNRARVRWARMIP